MRRLWMHLTGQSWMWATLFCKLGRHRYVQWATYDGPEEWSWVLNRTYPARREYVACGNPHCQKLMPDTDL